MTRRTALGALVSGRGTNLQAILDAVGTEHFPAEARIVVSNRPGAAALERAECHGVPTAVVNHKDYDSREAFDDALIALLRERGVELVVLAGFDRLLTSRFVSAFPDRILNIHPALLPAFPGLHAQRQALEYGVKITGCTVHFVDDKMDHGPVVLQAGVPVRDDDTEATLSERILAEEHRILPEAIRLFAEGRLRVEGRRVKIAEST